MSHYVISIDSPLPPDQYVSLSVKLASQMKAHGYDWWEFNVDAPFYEQVASQRDVSMLEGLVQKLGAGENVPTDIEKLVRAACAEQGIVVAWIAID